ncbi:MAG: hypothetical protein L6Q97_08475 [Thermoanaerobaculia bacterium]|nr:hypothetical protein [Thermoanaerobaculia bacterium]
MPSPDGVGRMPWKPIGILFLLLFLVSLVLYLVSVKVNRKLKRRIVGLTSENEDLQESLDAGNTELDALKQSAQTTTEPVPAQPPTGFRMPILNPGLKFNIQPDFSLPYPAFNAWNTGETLRVLALLDHAGAYGDFRQQPDVEPFAAWVFHLFTVGGALLKESHLPITGDGQPDGKRIVVEIRTLLESGLEEPPNT